MSMDSEKILKKISKNFWILGVVTGLQVDFLSDPQLSSTFGDLIVIELTKGFNLRHMTVLRSHKLKSYYVITKKLRQKSKIYDRKNDFLNFENMFLEHFCKAFNLQQTFSWYLTVFQKP